MRRLLDAAVLMLAVSLIGCNSLSDLVSEDPEHLLVLSIEPRSIPADGTSVATLEARLPAGAEEEDRVVTFSTSAGTFVDGAVVSSLPIEIEADVHGVAVVQLRSTLQVGSAIVHAKAGSSVRRGRVDFGLALPEQIDVSADKFVVQVSSSETAAVIATLRRSQGVATQGTVVQFTSTDSQGGVVGGFSSITASDSAGRATAVFSPGVTSFRGDVTIRASVPNPGGGTIQGETKIQIVD